MKILIVKTSSLGDIVQTFPLLSICRQLFPEGTIDWVVEKRCQGLVASHPFVNRCLEVDTKSWKKMRSWKSLYTYLRLIKQEPYDFIIDAQCNMKSFVLRMLCQGTTIGFEKGWTKEPFSSSLLDVKLKFSHYSNIYDRYLALVQPLSSQSLQPQPVALKLDLNDQAKFDQIATSFDPHRRLVMVCSGSFWENKKLPLPLWISFLKEIEVDSALQLCFIWGNDHEKKDVMAMSASLKPHHLILDKMSLPLLQRVMGLCSEVLSTDSFPLHLAHLAGVPSMGVFGPSLASMYLPPSDYNKGIQGLCPYQEVFSTRCRYLRKCKTGACTRDLSLKNLLEEYQAWSLQLKTKP